MSHILVIEDDPATRALVVALLQAQGHSTVEAANGRVGTDAFGAGGIDLVVSDIIMPEREGIETIRTIRRADPVVPILAMSAAITRNAQSDYLHAALALGASAVIRKPLVAGAFIAAVEDLLKSRTAGAAGP